MATTSLSCMPFKFLIKCSKICCKQLWYVCMIFCDNDGCYAVLCCAMLCCAVLLLPCCCYSVDFVYLLGHIFFYVQIDELFCNVTWLDQRAFAKKSNNNNVTWYHHKRFAYICFVVKYSCICLFVCSCNISITMQNIQAVVDFAHSSIAAKGAAIKLLPESQQKEEYTKLGRIPVFSVDSVCLHVQCLCVSVSH